MTLCVAYTGREAAQRPLIAAGKWLAGAVLREAKHGQRILAGVHGHGRSKHSTHHAMLRQVATRQQRLAQQLARVLQRSHQLLQLLRL